MVLRVPDAPEAGGLGDAGLLHGFGEGFAHRGAVADEGQVRGLHRMVDEDVYCIDVLTQVAAVTKALQSLSLNLTSEHLRHCVAEAAVQAEAEGRTELIDEKVAEATAALGRLLR